MTLEGTGADDLPETIPVFPLTGALLMPRGKLPLNIFEPRYLAMVRDALAAGRMIGMIQPTVHERGMADPPLYEVGCLGRITAFSETDDGRFLITLTGICRFRIARELDRITPYRKVVPDFDGFAADLGPEGQTMGPRRGPFLDLLKAFLETQGLTADWKTMEQAPDEMLVNAIAMIAPFEPAEKQALLESPDVAARATAMMALLEMALTPGGRPDAPLQ